MDSDGGRLKCLKSGRRPTPDESGPSSSREPCPGMLKSFPFSNKSRILLSGCNLLMTGIYSAANSSKVEFLKGYKVESGPRNFAFILYRPTSCFYRFKLSVRGSLISIADPSNGGNNGLTVTLAVTCKNSE